MQRVKLTPLQQHLLFLLTRLMLTLRISTSPFLVAFPNSNEQLWCLLSAQPLLSAALFSLSADLTGNTTSITINLQDTKSRSTMSHLPRTENWCSRPTTDFPPAMSRLASSKCRWSKIQPGRRSKTAYIWQTTIGRDCLSLRSFLFLRY